MNNSADNTEVLGKWVAGGTFAWLAVYVPLETYVTWSIAGVAGFLHPSFILNVVGMSLMFWGGVAVRNRRPAGPAVAAIGWSWTAATFWRATSDRFWWVSQGHELWAGRVELWLAPALTALALGGLVMSMVLVFRTAGNMRPRSEQAG
jgi:hypothetical protein